MNSDSTGSKTRVIPNIFLRIHPSHLVNRERVQELQPWFNDEYVSPKLT